MILSHNIDSPFITQMEQKNEHIKFQRIDADLTDHFKKMYLKKKKKHSKKKLTVWSKSSAKHLAMTNWK